MCSLFNPVIGVYGNINAGDLDYALPDDKSVRVMRLADVLLIRHDKIKVHANVFLDDDYFEERTNFREIMNVTGKYKNIWKRQAGKCFYCGIPILKDQYKELIVINPARKNTASNSAYVHDICRRGEYRQIHTMEDVEGMAPVDVMKTLRLIDDVPGSIKIRDRTSNPEWKYFKLRGYFAKSRRSTLSLTFSEIEKLSGGKLGKYLRTSHSAWYPRKDMAGIAYAWLS